MLERIHGAAMRLAVDATAKRKDALARSIETSVPNDIGVTQDGDAIVLSGRGLARRAAMETRLRWLAREAMR